MKGECDLLIDDSPEKKIDNLIVFFRPFLADKFFYN